MLRLIIITVEIIRGLTRRGCVSVFEWGVEQTIGVNLHLRQYDYTSIYSSLEF